VRGRGGTSLSEHHRGARAGSMPAAPAMTGIVLCALIGLQIGRAAGSADDAPPDFPPASSANLRVMVVTCNAGGVAHFVLTNSTAGECASARFRISHAAWCRGSTLSRARWRCRWIPASSGEVSGVNRDHCRAGVCVCVCVCVCVPVCVCAHACVWSSVWSKSDRVDRGGSDSVCPCFLSQDAALNSRDRARCESVAGGEGRASRSKSVYALPYSRKTRCVCVCVCVCVWCVCTRGGSACMRPGYSPGLVGE